MLIAAFLEAGADAKAKDATGKTALDYAQANPKLKGTDALRQSFKRRLGNRDEMASGLMTLSRELSPRKTLGREPLPS